MVKTRSDKLPGLIIYHHIPKCGGTFINKKLGNIFNYCRFSFKEVELAGLQDIKGKLYDRLGQNGERTFLELINLKNSKNHGIEFVTSHDMFDPRYFQKTKHDFFFTFIRNPVDRAYSSIYYMRRMAQHSHLKIFRQDKKYWSAPLDKHLDDILEAPFLFHYDPLSLKKFDFVGIVDEMDRSLEVINRVLGVNIINDEKINANEPKNYQYRRDELSRHFKIETKVYNDFKKRLLTNGYTGLPIFCHSGGIVF